MSNGNNGFEAIKAAGYSQKNYRVISNMSTENLSKPGIRAYISYLQKVSGCSDEDRIKKTVISIEERRELLTQFIKSDDIKYADKLKALDLLNKMDAAYEQKVQISGNVNNPMQNLTTEELRALINNNKKS